MQNEMQRQLDLINKLYAELDALKTAQEKNESRVNQLEAEKGNSGANTVSVGGSGSGPDSNSLQANLDKYNHGLERLEIIEQKLRLIPNSNDYESSMSELRTWIGEVEETVTILQEEIEAIKTKKTIDG
jgi:prefoldin subunit 5